LVTAMAKERTVRGKQRGELDAKASSAATSLSLLKGQLASTEELLESCREDAKMVTPCLLARCCSVLCVFFLHFKSMHGYSSVCFF